MTEMFRFFDSAVGDTREYNADQFGEYFKTLINTGLVQGALNDLQVTADGLTMKSTIDTGNVFIDGYWYENDLALELEHDVETVGNDRIDRVVIRLDKTVANRFVKAFIVKGTAGVTPTAPALTRTSDVYELSLAQVYITGGQSFIDLVDVTEERGNVTLCPYANSNILPSYDAQDLTDLETAFNEHSARHEVGGADVISLEDLAGESTALKSHKAEYATFKFTYSNPSNFLLANENEGTQIGVTWTNPDSNDLIARELYVSTSDITNADRDYCNANATLLAGTIGTGSNTADAYNYASSVGITYYFKIFSKYEMAGDIKYSIGVSGSITATDVTPPDDVTSFTATAGNTEVELSWTDPSNADWAGTKIMRKIGSYPANEIDGVLVVNSTVKDEHSATPFTDTGLTNNTLYYYQAFPYDSNGNYNTNIANRASATPIPYYIYGVKIDTTNSNPETALVYTNDAIGFTPATGNNGTFGYGSWADKFPFNQIKPCLYLNGAVNYYLDPNDYTLKEDGVTASDITSGTDGDVMVEFPKIWWKFETIGSDLYVRYADTQIDANYKPLAHLRGTTEKDMCYISAYLGYDLSSNLRSLSGKTPTATQTIGAFRILAQANGAGYDQMAYFQSLMLQVLFIVMFKNRDSQTALGRGFVDGNAAATATGGTNAKGMFYGETTGQLQNKFCGIEDFYGNLRYWIDGFFSNATWNILIANQSFNDTGSGYTDYGQGATANLSGYISTVQGGTETGFVVKATAGSATTYYADSGALYASRLPIFGGYWANADTAGAFYLTAGFDASSSASSIGARLLAL